MNAQDIRPGRRYETTDGDMVKVVQRDGTTHVSVLRDGRLERMPCVLLRRTWADRERSRKQYQRSVQNGTDLAQELAAALNGLGVTGAVTAHSSPWHSFRASEQLRVNVQLSHTQTQALLAVLQRAAGAEAHSALSALLPR